MKITILIVFALSYVCTGAEYDGFQVSYSEPSSGQGFYDMPWTVAEATSQGKWVKIDDDRTLNTDVYSQPNDPRVLLLFDKRGNIAGIRVSYLKDDVKTKAEAGGHKFEVDYDNTPFYEAKRYFDKDLWYSTVLFVSRGKLASGGRRTTLNKATDNAIEGVWFKPEQEWIEVSKDECTYNKDFVEANCYPGMGKHYFYKLLDEDCKHRTIFFSLYNEGKVIGFGLGGFGPFSKDPKTQSYYDNLPLDKLKEITPKGSKCVGDFIGKYGLTTMHVYFKKNASKLSCPAQDWRATNC